MKKNKNCHQCSNKIYVKPSKLKKHKAFFCSVKCQVLWQKGKGAKFGKENPAYGKTYRTKSTHPEWADKISKTLKKIRC